MTQRTDEHASHYVKAMQFDWLTPAYDFVVRWTIPEEAFRRELIDQARIASGQRALDLGCGTGTLCVEIKRRHPDAEVSGIDGDPRILELARDKARAAGTAVTFAEGMSYRLPYPDGGFDRVFSTLMLHHLTPENRLRTAEEAFRVLRPGGSFHVADFGRPHNLAMRAASLTIRVLGGHGHLEDNLAGRLPAIFTESGFERVRETERFSTFFGTLALYVGVKPSA
ncbi:MAG: class I SAM-dependent methyltransferase [Candidatus Binatia bacterium]